MGTDTKHILFISHSGGWRGGEKALFQLATGVDAGRFSVSVVVPGPGPLEKMLNERGIRTYRVELSPWIAYATGLQLVSGEQIGAGARKIKEIVEREGVDIVHSNTSIIAEGAIGAYWAGVPHLWHLHEFLEGHPSLVPRFPLYLTYRFVDLMSDAVVAVSGNLYRSVAGSLGEERLHVVADGIDPFAEVSPAVVRGELKLPADAIIVAVIGHILEEKGYETLLQAAKDACARESRLVFLVAGEKSDSALTAKLEEGIRRNGLHGRFLLLGYREDIPALLSVADMCVCSSVTESFGLSLVEAMSLGKPVVSTRCGGPDEIVIDGETGLLVPVADAAALAGAIVELASSPETRKSMGEKGFQRFKTHYTSSRYCQSFEQLYARLGNRRRLSEEDQRFADALLELLLKGRQLGDDAVESLLNSLSWRITAPLRKLHSMLMRGRA